MFILKILKGRHPFIAATICTQSRRQAVSIIRSAFHEHLTEGTWTVVKQTDEVYYFCDQEHPTNQFIRTNPLWVRE